MFTENPEKIIISDKAFDKLSEILESETVAPEALVELMKRKKSWENTEAALTEFKKEK